MNVYWRSKEGSFPPPNAQLLLQPFRGTLSTHAPTVIHELPIKAAPVRVLKRVDRPNRTEWQKAVTIALQEEPLKKVVLARQTILTLERAPDPFQIAAALQAKAKGAALFCIQFNERTAFLGASPERLFQRKGREIWVDALAGTKKKGLEKELISSEKDRREFQFVQDFLRETLTPHCETIDFSPIGLYQTANLCHLYSQGVGHLLPDISDLELLQALHPTPALCGTPKEKAFEWIEQNELFDRNLYGGVIGWATPEESDWTVPIRCCFLVGNTACIYTGTGIVAGSDPEAEWNELEAKLSLYEEIFPWS